MEKVAPSLLRRRGGVRWVGLAIFFLALGLGEVCTGDAWNLPAGPAGGTGALAPVRFNKMHCACAWTDIPMLHIVRHHNDHNHHNHLLRLTLLTWEWEFSSSFSGTLSRALYRKLPCSAADFVGGAARRTASTPAPSTVTSRWRSSWSWQQPSTTLSGWRGRERERSTRSTTAFGQKK